jgi:hypothetical protein
MMLPTHALIGVALALPLAVAFPESASGVLLAGLLGGLFPDLDMYFGHRKTLHYPTYYTGFAVVSVPVTVLFTTTVTIAVTVFLIGAAVHSVMDIFGSGLELRPWEANSDRAVYDHHRGQWLAPRHWIRYDGAPEDFFLSAVVGLPLLIGVDGVFRWVVISAIIVAAVYTTVRRILPALAVLLVDRFLVERLPDRALAYIPPRYLQDDSVW